jgi:hypothetical protein
MVFAPRSVLVAAALLLVAACGGGGGGGGGGDDLDALDQDFTPSPLSCGTGLGSPPEKAMTFTVGRTGTLVRVDLELQRGTAPGDDDVAIELRPTVGGVPDPDDGDVIASGVLSSSDWPASSGLYRIDLPGGVPVAAGETYAIVLRTLGSLDPGGWSGSGDASDYAGGDGYYRDPSVSGAFALLGCDLAFRTHVE